MTKLDWVGAKIAAERYKILAQLGEGGMGTVFRAYDCRLETEVVIKCPQIQSLNEAFRQRFDREIRSLIRLSHPHIVRVLDVGTHEDVPFFVMQYLSGGSLKSRIYPGNGSPQPQSSRSLRKWLPQIASALDFTHSQHYLHRDVKPANIIFDEQGNAFLSDFGLTRVADQQESFEQQQLTESGHFVGTVHYVSPESIMGRELDGRSDQYSLAITVYEALSGRLPFTGPTSSAVLVKHTSEKAQPLHELVPELPPELSEVLGQAMSRRPTARFISCAEFAEAVLEHCQGARASIGAGQMSADGVLTSRGENGQIPCPKCGRILALQPTFAGKKAVCQYCRTRLQISADLTELSTIPPKPVVSSINNPMQQTATHARPSSPTSSPLDWAQPTTPSAEGRIAPSKASGSEDLIVLEERVFGLRISRRQATAIGVVTLLVFLAVVGLLGYQALKPKPAEVARVSDDAGSRLEPADAAPAPVNAARVDLSLAGSAEVLNTVMKAVGRTDDLHLNLHNKPVTADDVIRSVLLGDRNLTVHAWLCDSPIDLERLDGAWRRTRGTSLYAASRTVAWTPLVFVTTKSRIQGYRSGEIRPTIGDLLKLETEPPLEEVKDVATGKFNRRRALRLRLPHPAQTATGKFVIWQAACEAQPVIGAFEPGDFVKPEFRQLTDRLASAWLPASADAGGDAGLIKHLMSNEPEFDFTVVDERSAIVAATADDAARSELQVLYPNALVGRELTLCILDAPWVSAEQRAAAERLAEHLLSKTVQKKLFDDGWRTVNFSFIDAGEASPPRKFPGLGLAARAELRQPPAGEAAEALYDAATAMPVPTAK